MDLVSFNTPGEFEMFSEIMKRGRRLSSISVFLISSFIGGRNFIYP